MGYALAACGCQGVSHHLPFFWLMIRRDAKRVGVLVPRRVSMRRR